MKFRLKTLLFCAIFCVAHTMTAQSLAFFESFTDHAVLQRNVEHPVWGWAEPGAKVSLTVGEQVFRGVADKSGRWEVRLPAQKAGGPHTFTLVSAKEKKKIRDLHFGDVYLLSGQSNMEWKLNQSDLDGSRAAAIADPLIREVTVAKSFARLPENQLTLSAPWRLGTAENIGNFSGVGSYFAHYVREEVEVPIGLLHSSWGGSRIEAWMNAETLGIEAGSTMGNEDLEQAIIRPALEKYRKDFGQVNPPTTDNGAELGYLNQNTDYAAWPTIPVPGLWEENGYRAVNGHFYFARYFELTQDQANGKAVLHLGAIDDSDWTYVNGQLVGEMYGAYATDRSYKIRPGVLKTGRNVVLVRVEDTGGGGGLTAAASQVKLSTGQGDVALAGDWHYQIGSFSVDQNRNQVPTILYNKMIHPLAKMPLAGVLWYQGESNAGAGDAEAYAQQFKDMIQAWRAHFDRPELPFYWVQLANFKDRQQRADEVGWATLRNSQTAALDLPYTGQAVITDIGEANDIHPRNKWEVGRRLSLHALKNIYGQQDLVASSPMATGAIQAGERVIISFDHTGEGLTTDAGEGGEPSGFVYQNNEGEWNWATATLQEHGHKISIKPRGGDSVQKIRYNWADNPVGNVFSKAGLPLTPFEIILKEN